MNALLLVNSFFTNGGFSVWRQSRCGQSSYRKLRTFLDGRFGYGLCDLYAGLFDA